MLRTHTAPAGIVDPELFAKSREVLRGATGTDLGVLGPPDVCEIRDLVVGAPIRDAMLGQPGLREQVVLLARCAVPTRARREKRLNSWSENSARAPSTIWAARKASAAGARPRCVRRSPTSVRDQ